MDVDHGIYPFTTSSNTATGHISTGTGVSYRELNRVIGVVKGYLSRVGESPLPTEIQVEKLNLCEKEAVNTALQLVDHEELDG